MNALILVCTVLGGILTSQVSHANELSNRIAATTGNWMKLRIFWKQIRCTARSKIGIVDAVVKSLDKFMDSQCLSSLTHKRSVSSHSISEVYVGSFAWSPPLWTDRTPIMKSSNEPTWQLVHGTTQKMLGCARSDSSGSFRWDYVHHNINCSVLMKWRCISWRRLN